MSAQRECTVSYSNATAPQSVLSLVIQVPKARSRPLASAHSMRTDSIAVMGPTTRPLIFSSTPGAVMANILSVTLPQTSLADVNTLFHRLLLQAPPHGPLQTRGHGTKREARRKDDETSNCLTSQSLPKLQRFKDKCPFNVSQTNDVDRSENDAHNDCYEQQRISWQTELPACTNPARLRWARL